jgi:hypothetical protein
VASARSDHDGELRLKAGPLGAHWKAGGVRESYRQTVL